MRFHPKEFPPKAELEVKFYAVDWQNRLGTDTISTATWSAEPTGELTFANETLTESNTVANAKISGGQPGRCYEVICRIVTVTQAETFEVRIPLTVLQDPGT
jgi:hypothetical protein